MAEKQGSENLAERALKYCVAHQFPEVITRKKLTLELYRNASRLNQRKLLRIMSEVSKNLRQDHANWHLFLSPIYERRTLLAWTVSDNPHDWILDVARTKALAISFTERIVEEIEALDISKLNGEKLKELAYKLKASRDMAVKWIEELTQDQTKMAKLIPIEELKRREKTGMRIPKILTEKIGEN